jgi:dTDP-4-amino-4,6-dideoxygalactose transaminase
MLREHGEKARYYHHEIGVNSRLDALQAAILQIKLRYLDTWNDQRRAIAARYHQFLQLVPNLVTPQEWPGAQGVWNQYTIRITSDQGVDSTGVTYRDNVRSLLQQRGIGAMIYYPRPLHLQPVYEGLGYQLGQLPVAEQACHEVLSLPIFPELSIEQQDQVIYSLKDCLTN